MSDDPQNASQEPDAPEEQTNAVPQSAETPILSRVTSSAVRNGTPRQLPFKEWVASALTSNSLLGFLALDLSSIATISTLAVVSSHRQGFATIPRGDDAASLPNSGMPDTTYAKGENQPSLFDLGVLWTTIPSLFFQIFSVYWVWIADALVQRQPYVELRRAGGVSADRSILLDYRATPKFWIPVRAFKLSHSTVAFAVLVGLALQFAVAPLSARLFAAQTVMIASDAPLLFPSEFDWSALDDNLDWRPVFATVRATLAQDGDSLPWTDEEHAFRPFRTKTPPVSGSFEVTANTTAFSAYLSCETVVGYTMALKRGEDAGEGVLTVTGSDRGCGFEQTLEVTTAGNVFMKATPIQDCSNTAGFSRLVFTTGTYSPTSPYLLSNISVISCASLYQRVSGMLRISLSESSVSKPLSILSFAQTGTSDTRRVPSWRVIELGMLSPVVFNPGTQWSIPDFGGVVLYHAQKTAADPGQSLSAEVLKRSISRVFTTAYLVAVATEAFNPLPTEEMFQGLVLVPTPRLFVVGWVAYVILILLAMAMGLTCWLLYIIPRNPSILAEDPNTGLVAVAGTLQNSDVMTAVSEIRQQPGYDGKAKETGTRCGLLGNTLWMAEQSPHGAGEWVIKRAGGSSDCDDKDEALPWTLFLRWFRRHVLHRTPK